MSTKHKANLKLIDDLCAKHKDCLEVYAKVKETSRVTSMSKNAANQESMYGMFLPDDDLIYVPIIIKLYEGELTDDENQMDFKYYFNDDGKVVLTERYIKKKLDTILLYFYHENTTEIILYFIKEKTIGQAGIIEYCNDKISRVLFSEYPLTFNVGYFEITYKYNGEWLDIEEGVYFGIPNLPPRYALKSYRFRYTE